MVSYSVFHYKPIINLFIETIWDKYTKKSPLPIPKSQANHLSLQKSQTAQAPKEKQKSSYYRSGNSFDK